MKTNNYNVDYSSAQIKMYEGPIEIGVNSIKFDNIYYGLPNSIQWKMNNFKNNTTYDVKINNVKVNGVVKNYEYTFIVN
ncbi:MAG: hypothetical protein IPG85_16985 [Bacteroidetes bacterium]|nr:hypothetical protein [Bacteroidota bacterium]